MAKTAVAAFRLVQNFSQFPLSLLVSCQYHLCYAFAIVYHKRFAAQVYQYHAYQATVVGVYRSRSVQYRDAVLQGQAATGAYLSLHASGQSYA